MKAIITYCFLFLFVLAASAQTQPSNIRFSLIYSEKVYVVYDIVGPAPDGYLAIMSANFAPTFEPVDGTAYTSSMPSLGQVNGNDMYAVYADFNNSFYTENHAPNTLLYYKIFAYNGSGTSIVYNHVNPLEGNVTTPTQTLDELISYNGGAAPEEVAAGAPLIVSFNFVDPGLGITDLELNFGPVELIENIGDYYEDYDYDQVPNSIITRAIDNPSGSSYQVTIDGEEPTEVGKIGVIYIIIGHAANGNVYLLDYPRVVSVAKAAETVPIYTNFGTGRSNYQLIAIPRNLDPSTVDDVLGDDLGPYGNKKEWRMFQYDGTNKEVTGATVLAPGYGYWLIAKTETTIDIGPGTTVVTAGHDLKIGWNLVGNPYPFDLEWSIIKDWTSQNLGDLRLFEDGSFTSSDVLPAYTGGFAMSSEVVGITFPPIDNSGARIGGRVSKGNKMENALDNNNWEVLLDIKSADMHYNLGGIGMRTDANSLKDKYDDFTLPRFIEYIEINHDKKFYNISYSKDIVPSEENHEWTFEIESNTNSDVIDLSWDNSYFGSNTKQLVLWDVKAQRVIDMREQNQYVFNKNRSGDFKIFFGEPEYVKEKTSVETLVFHPVYPNPATDQFVVSFTLPQQENVTIELFDVLGRKATALVTHSFDAGYHEVPVQYKGMSGVYIVQLSTGHSKESQRLMLGN